ncbi:MAG TPA: hypothetical protein H9887_09605 [Candidatus Dorea intestinavium]|nr:hypothetical protein [Candidatus Dorea intestinavium]
MKTEEKLAKFIRILTVPPLLVILMLSLLNYYKPELFGGIRNYVISLLGLGICPILAYPLQSVLPKWKDKGREGQRSLAFLVSVISYALLAIYGLITGVDIKLQLIYNTYIFSVLLLLVLNKGLKIKASGHACSITGPLIFLIYFISWKLAFFCILIGGFSFWASIKLKRHTLKDLVIGSATCILSFGVAFLIMI